MTKPATLRIKGPKVIKTTELRTRHCRPKMSLSQTKACLEFLYVTRQGLRHCKIRIWDWERQLLKTYQALLKGRQIKVEA